MQFHTIAWGFPLVVLESAFVNGWTKIAIDTKLRISCHGLFYRIGAKSHPGYEVLRHHLRMIPEFLRCPKRSSIPGTESFAWIIALAYGWTVLEHMVVLVLHFSS